MAFLHNLASSDALRMPRIIDARMAALPHAGRSVSFDPYCLQRPLPITDVRWQCVFAKYRIAHLPGALKDLCAGN